MAASSEMMIYTDVETGRQVLWVSEVNEFGDVGDSDEFPPPRTIKRGEIIGWIREQGYGHRLVDILAQGGEQTWGINGPQDDTFVSAFKIMFW
ncbi:hypothetical protein SAMN04487843_101374 [Methylobacterium sp. ap11]|nr:hypothetical protein SAMN04487843_101374 [Methylobacterium sp. ap11]